MKTDFLVKEATIERLHELDDTEARREGFNDREEFIKYWNIINTERGFSWDYNPWVYRIVFKRGKKTKYD
jgi:hypothetical protein